MFAPNENKRKKKEYSFVKVSACVAFIFFFVDHYMPRGMSNSPPASPSLKEGRAYGCTSGLKKKAVSKATRDIKRSHMFILNRRRRRKLLVSCRLRLPATQIIPCFSFVNFIFCSFYVSSHTLMSQSCLNQCSFHSLCLSILYAGKQRNQTDNQRRVWMCQMFSRGLLL